MRKRTARKSVNADCLKQVSIELLGMELEVVLTVLESGEHASGQDLGQDLGHSTYSYY